jgi:hypothetical protein
MTRTISLIIGITATALAIGVPTAFGEGRLAGSLEPAQVAPDWFERAAINAQNDALVVSRPDSHDIVTQPDNGYLDAAARAQRIDVIVPTASSDAHERSAPPRGEFVRQTDVSGSGTELELPQIGIGFAVGLLLALGMFLTVRYTRGGRELAH